MQEGIGGSTEIRFAEHHDANPEQKEHSVDTLQDYLHRASTMCDELSFWQSKKDRKLRSLVQDVHNEGNDSIPEEVEEKVTSLKLKIDKIVVLFSNLGNKILTSDSLSQMLETKLGKKITSLDQAKDTAKELIRPFYEQYHNHLKATGGKEKKTLDVISSDEAAWDITGISVPSGLDIMDDKKLQALQERRKSFTDLIIKLSLLPGPHQKYAKSLLEGRGNAQDADLLLNSYSVVVGGSKKRFGNLDIEHGKEDLQKLETLLAEAVQFIEEISQRFEIEISSEPEGLPLETAELILGKEKVFGPEEALLVWGVELQEVPEIPFTKEDLEKAKALGMYLILRLEKDKDGNPLTGQRMHELKQAEFKKQNKGKILYDINWYKDEEFFRRETPQLAWALTSGGILADSIRKNYIEQTRFLRDSLKQQGWLSEKEERECTDKRLQEIRKIMEDESDPQCFVKSSELLQKLMINQNHRLSFADTLYDFISVVFSKKKRILLKTWNWTKSRSSDGGLVVIGGCDEVGADVSTVKNLGRWNADLGVAFSR